jgi:DMSO reductase family type II enzyme heme b subunit
MAQQNVAGQGVWHDGFWSVVFMRDLASKEADDVNFQPGKATPVAFAVWNGEQGDRNGRKMVSNWYQLLLEKNAPAKR